MPNNTGMISAIIAIVMQVLVWSGVQLTDQLRLDVQNAIAEVITLGGLLWTLWRHWHDKGTVQKLTSQVVLNGYIPLAGPKKGKLPTHDDVTEAQEVLKK